MPFAATHIIITAALVSLYYRYIAKKRISSNFLLWAGIAGLIPDADFVAEWIYYIAAGSYVPFHRLITHTLIFPLLLFLITGILSLTLKEREYKIFRWNAAKRSILLFFGLLAFGWLMHDVLDCAISGDKFVAIAPNFGSLNCRDPISLIYAAQLDAVILVLWLSYAVFRKKLKDFI